MLLLALLENAGKFFKYRKGFRNAGKVFKCWKGFKNAGKVLKMQERLWKVLGKVLLKRKSGKGFKIPGKVLD